MANRITQVVRQTAITATPKVRTTQVARMTAIVGDAKARVGQVVKLTSITPIFSLVGDFLSATDKISANTISGTTTRAINTGEIAVVLIATDNTSTTSGNTTLHSSLTIGAYSATKIREYTNAGAGANAGVTLSAWYLTAPAVIGSASTVTANLSDTKTAKAMTGMVFIKNSALALVIDGFSEAAATNNNPAAMSLNGSYTGDHIWIRAMGVETDLATVTGFQPTDGWSLFKTSATSGSTADTNIIAVGEFAFRYGQSSGTSDPSFKVGMSSDQSSILFGLTVLNNQTYNEFPTGGAKVDGIPQIAKIASITTSGGATLNGTINLQNTSDFTASGGVQLSGASIDYFISEFTASGGILLNGECDFIDQFDEIGFGGIVVNGFNNEFIIQNPFMDGGVSLNGSAEIYAFEETSIFGGIIASGESLISEVFEAITDGGVVVNGEAFVDFTYNVEPIKGCILSGNIEVIATYNLIFLGGCVLNGKTPQGIKNTSIKIPIIKIEPKYAVGDKVYVRCSKMCCHVLQAIKFIDRNENIFIYDCGIGQFTENNVLSIQEFEKLESSVKKDLLCARRTEEI